MQRPRRVIISGGGTGGHIFPAIAIANALVSTDSNIELLFVGARGRMEMERVPAAGYRIEGLPVRGFIRKPTLKNLAVLAALMKSLRMSARILKEFKPDAVVGVGGYASGPVLRVASRKGIPTLIQEQNSYAGITNRLLAKRASTICVAYDRMDRYFPAGKIKLTGNPVRDSIREMSSNRKKAFEFFGLDEEKPALLVVGGSLGSATINRSVADGLIKLSEAGVNLIWQTGKGYIEEMKERFTESGFSNGVIVPFIDRMDLAFQAADAIISRAGAGTISELAIAGKPVILVPSPNVAEDHQTRNAMSLVDKKAAIMVADKDAGNELIGTSINIINDNGLRSELSYNISKLALPNSSGVIAEEIIKLFK